MTVDDETKQCLELSGHARCNDTIIQKRYGSMYHGSIVKEGMKESKP